MSRVQIPRPEEPSKEPTEITQMEMAELSTEKRNTVLYERLLAQSMRQSAVLEGNMEEMQKHNSTLLQKDADHKDACVQVATLKRAQTEMAVSFGLATIAMAVGGALISSFPFANGIAPWQFALGWTLLLCGVVFGFTSRLIVWAVEKFMGPAVNA